MCALIPLKRSWATTIAIVFIAWQTPAADKIWNGGGADDSWTSGTNWDSGVAPSPGDRLFFDGDTRLTPVNDFPPGTVFGSLIFNSNAGAFTLSGNLILLGGSVTNASPNVQAVNLELTLTSGNHTIVTASGAGQLTFGGAVMRNPGAVAQFIQNGGSITIPSLNNVNGILGGWAIMGGNWAEVDLLGTGEVIPYSGYTDVSAPGSIDNDPTSNVRIIAATGNVSLTDPGTTDINTLLYGLNSAQTVDVGAGNILRLGPLGGISRGASITNVALTIGAFVGSGSITAGGADGSSGEIVLDAGGATQNTIVINSIISDNSTGQVAVIKAGQAAATLSATNTYSGGTYVSQGRLQANNATSLGSGPVFVLSGGEAFLSGQAAYANSFFVAGIGTTDGNGALRSLRVIAGPITLLADTRVGGGLNIAGKITGNSGLEIGGGPAAIGNNTLASILNDYTGDTAINSAGGSTSLVLGNSGVIPDGAGKGNVIINGGAPLAILNLNGHNETINGLNSTGAVANTRVNSSVGGPVTLTIGNGNANGSFAGAIQNGAGTVALTKIGAGTQILSGTNTYTGATTVAGGTLAVKGSLAAGSAVTVSSNGVLAGTGTIGGSTTVSAGGLLAPGDGAIGTLTMKTNLTLAGTALMKLYRTNTTFSDRIVASAVLYGGALTLILDNTSLPLQAGDCFTLFTAANYTGSFAVTNLPLLPPGLVWDTSNLLLNGSICVVAPQIVQYTIGINPGDNLVANQVKIGGNTLDEVLPTVPDGTMLYKWNGVGYSVYTYDAILPGWSGGPGTLAPGEGAILRFPAGDPTMSLTFTGTPHVPVLPLTIACGSYYLLSRQTNGVGTFENITGVSPQDGTELLRHIAGMPATPLQPPNYTVYRFCGGIWSPGVPYVDIGEAVWIRMPCFPSACLSVHAPDIVVISNTLTEISFSPELTDACGGIAGSVVCTPPSGGLFAPGSTPVHCVAIDATGSAASCDFLVTVAPPPIPVYTTSYPYNIFAGLNFIANQLDLGGNTLREIIPVAPDGATVLKFDNTNGTWVKLSRYNATLKAWVPPTVTLAPGEGALLQSPNSFSLTFTGTPRSPVLPNAIPDGECYLISRQTPEIGTYESITGGVPPVGTRVYRYNPLTGTYTENDYLAGGWTAGFPPLAAVGESIWICAPGAGLPPPIPVPPSLSLQPASLAVSLGSDAAFSVMASGDQPLYFQWRLNGNIIPGATNSSLAFTNIQTTNAGTYNVAVYNAVGIVDSTNVTLLITDIPALPFANTFSAAGTLGASTNGLGSGSNLGATIQPGEPDPGYIPGGASVWVRWQPMVSGIANFTTAGSGFDTLLAIYAGASINTLTRIAANDDGAGFLCSSASFNAVGGVDYAVQVDGFYGEMGNILLAWDLQTTTNQLPVILAQTKSVTTGAGSNATFSVTVQAGPTVAYQWSMNGVPILGQTNATLNITTVTASNVGVYQVEVTDTQSSLSILSLPFDLQINSAGEGEPINADTRAVDKFLAAVDTTVRPNDPYDPAIVSGFTGTQIFTTYGTSGDPGEPEHCGVLCAFTKWHYYSFPSNSLVRLDNHNTTFGGVLAVYSGIQSAATYGTLVPIACSASHGAGNEEVSFLAEAGATYSVMMAGTNLADIGGTVVLNHTETRPPFFTVLPISQTVPAAHSLMLAVATSGYPPVGYQWQLNGTNIPGANGATLSFSPFAAGNQGNYSIMATNAAGTNVFAFTPVYLNTSLHFVNPTPVRNLFTAQFVGMAARSYIIQASSDLINWAPVLTNASASGIITFAETNRFNPTNRYFRAITPPAIP